MPDFLNLQRTARLICAICVFFLLLPARTIAQNPESLNRRGVEAGEEENFDEARENFNRAADNYDGVSAQILHNRAMVYERQGNIPAAVQSYEEAVRRNPEQYQSLERLGYWKYKQGDFGEAVKLGEAALRLDPENEKVKQWIEEAYKKKIDSFQKSRPSSTSESGKYYTTEGKHFPPRYDPLDLYRSELFVTFDASLVFQSEPAENSIAYKWTSGPITNFPYDLSVHYRPYKKWAFFLELEHPYTGASLPNVCGQSERAEARFYAGDFVFGGGFLLKHYQDDFFNNEELSMMDLKAGGSIHYESGDSIIDAIIYPRLIIPDGDWSNKLTYDIAFHQFQYGFRYSPSLMYYTRFAQADFYFFNHDETFSDYYGYLDLAIGGEIVNHTLLNTVDLTFSGEIGKRLNLERTGVDKPYAFMNGQGFLGIDIMQDGGSYVSGQKSSGSILKLGIKERFESRFFAYQTLYADMPGYGSQYQNFLLLIGLGYVQ